MFARFVKPAAGLAACLIAAACVSAEPAAPSRVSADDWSRIRAGMDAFMERAEAREEFPPGSALIVVTSDGRRYVRVHGTPKAGGGAEATADTPFYIASMTKAYMGLLAIKLDAAGVLDLDATLADTWPGLTLPEGRSADAVTLRDLLLHRTPFRAPEIVFLEAYVREVAPSEYPGLIETYAVPREEGFRYDNLGYNIYAAILQQETGKNWRDWLDEEIFTPLGMTQTSGRTSDYDPAEIAWSHQRVGAHEDGWPKADGWYLIPPKSDGMMQSAGGLMTTANDMAAWLTANLSRRAPRRSGLTSATFELAQEKSVDQEPDGHGFSCDGYAYGWNTCVIIFEGDDPLLAEKGADIGPLLGHGGGYTGVRSLMTIAPEHGLGVAFLSNSDSMTGFFSNEVSKLALELAVNLAGADERADARLDAYVSQNAAYLENLQKSITEVKADPKWEGWTWAPDETALSAFAGAYIRQDALLSRVEVEAGPSALLLRGADRIWRLMPAQTDLFGAQTSAYDDIGEVRFIRGEDGAVVALEWDGDRYERLP